MDYFFNFYNIAQYKFEVNPLIFIVIYVAATPFYYLGAAKAGFAMFNFYKRHKGTKFRYHDLLLDKEFLFGYILNRVSWLLPYIYVIFFGHNLPLKFIVLLIVWSFFSAYIFFHNIRTNKVKFKLRQA